MRGVSFHRSRMWDITLSAGVGVVQVSSSTIPIFCEPRDISKFEGKTERRSQKMVTLSVMNVGR
jgi:hypothetical protein